PRRPSPRRLRSPLPARTSPTSRPTCSSRTRFPASSRSSSTSRRRRRRGSRRSRSSRSSSSPSFSSSRPRRSSVSTTGESTIAVVGDGFGSLLVYSTAVYLGFRPAQLTIYGDSPHAVSTYQQYAGNLRQTVLRSESESHFLPADWPTFAQL